MMRLGASLAGGVVAEGRTAKGARAGTRAAAAGAEAGVRDWLAEERIGEAEAEEDGAAALLSMDDASLSLLIPSLAGAGAGSGGGGSGFQVHAESGYSPAVPAFLASAWSSLRGTSSSTQVEMGSMLMMDEGLVEGEEGQEDRGEEDDSVVLAAPHLLQQPPLPSVMEPSPPPPKPDFNRNDNFTVNVRICVFCTRVYVCVCS